MSSIQWKRRYSNDFIDRFMNDTIFRVYIGAGIVGTIIIIWCIIGLINYRSVEKVSVHSIGWDTQIDVYRWQTNNHGDWYIPSGGRETDHYQKQRGSTRVIVGYKRVKHDGGCYTTGSGKNKTRRCNPDTYSNDPIYAYKPIYDTWYEYDIEEWTAITPLKASGNDHKWRMPDTTDDDYTAGNNPSIGDKKLGLQRTHFFVVLTNDKKQYPIDLPENKWQTYNVGDKYNLTLNFFGNILSIDKTGVW